MLTCSARREVGVSAPGRKGAATRCSPGLLAAQTISSAMSCALSGVRPSYTFLAASSSPRKRVMEKLVSTMPGAMHVTRMFQPTSSRSKEPLKAWTACSGVRSEARGACQIRG